jgi:hypothetical protein
VFNRAFDTLLMHHVSLGVIWIVTKRRIELLGLYQKHVRCSASVIPRVPDADAGRVAPPVQADHQRAVIVDAASPAKANMQGIKCDPLRADAVEKVRGMPAERNNRISGASFLNRTCAYGARLESILLADPPQNLFSTASINNGGYDRTRITSVRCR